MRVTHTHSVGRAFLALCALASASTWLACSHADLFINCRGGQARKSNNMRRIYFCALGLFLLVALAAGRVSNQTVEVKPNSAEVESMQGLYVFIHAKPVAPYQTLGTFSPKLVPSKNAESIIEFMVNKGKDKFPSANAIVFKNAELSEADLVIVTP